MSPQNQAAWIPSRGSRITISQAPYPQIEPDSVILKNAAVALNPLDDKMQNYGIMVKSWPTILGTDIAGEIVSVGNKVTHLHPGQRVAGLGLSIVTGNHAQAAFQLYTSVPSNLVIPIPDTLSFTDAAVLPLSVSCAAAALYGQRGLQLPLPKPDLTGYASVQTAARVLIWGGSSSVGSSAIQLARASGLRVIATASARNFDQVRKLGASAVVDYSDSEVVEKLCAALGGEGTSCVGAFDTVGANVAQCADVLQRLGGGRVATTLEVPEGLPGNVLVNQIYATSIKNDVVGEAIMRDYLPRALAEKSFVPWPPAEVIGEGLDQIQAGIERFEHGVSNRKLVVALSV